MPISSSLRFCPDKLNFVTRNSRLRQASMQWTDKRAKILQELLGGMKIIKFFAWEVPFLDRIFGFRQKEMASVHQFFKTDF